MPALAKAPFGAFFVPALAAAVLNLQGRLPIMETMHPHHCPALSRPWRRTCALALATPLWLLLAGCDIPGLGPDPRVAQREAESQAIGGACRHALRGLEDCFTLNPKASKSAVFAGWKDMDAYMRDNKLEGAPSVLGRAEALPRAARQGEADGDANATEAQRTAGGASGRS